MLDRTASIVSAVEFLLLLSLRRRFHEQGGDAAGRRGSGSRPAPSPAWRSGMRSVTFGHIGPHHQDVVRIDQVPFGKRRRSPAIARAQSWDRGAVSDAGLVLDPDHAKAGDGGRCWSPPYRPLRGVAAAAATSCFPRPRGSGLRPRIAAATTSRGQDGEVPAD